MTEDEIERNERNEFVREVRALGDKVTQASQLQATTVREKEKIEGMPDLPTIENLDAWRMKSRECIATTSSAPDKARIWMKECDSKTEEELKDPSPFPTLD